MDLSDSENNYPSGAGDMELSGSESGSSAYEDSYSSDAEDMDTSSSEDSTASSIALPPTNYLRFSGPASRQNWALPESIIFYMAKHPSTPRFYRNIILSCKYFFLTNPITICSQLKIKGSKEDGVFDDDDEEEEDTSNDDDGEGTDVWQIKQKIIRGRIIYGISIKDIDLKNYSAKLWIDDSSPTCITSLIADVKDDNRNLISSIIPKIYRCNVAHLSFCNQDITFNEFTFLSSSASRVELSQVTVKDDDGMVVPVEKVFEVVPKATWFTFDCQDNAATVSSETVKHLLTIPHFSSMINFALHNIPESFDIDAIFTYLKEHKATTFSFHFPDSISAAYKKRLEKIVDEIIEARNRGGYQSPIIEFNELDEEKRQRIFLLFIGFGILLP